MGEDMSQKLKSDKNYCKSYARGYHYPNGNIYETFN